MRVGLKKGLLSLPPEPTTPIICIGPGTGIAPMRAVIEQRTFSGSSGMYLPPKFKSRSDVELSQFDSEHALLRM